MLNNLQKISELFEKNPENFLRYIYQDISEKYYVIDDDCFNSLVSGFSFPEEISKLLNILTLRISNFEKLIYLVVALRVVKSSQSWIHWNIISLLRQLFTEKSPFVSVIILAHSNAILINNENDSNTKALPYAEICKITSLFFPRDSVMSGLNAIKLGNKSPFPFILEASAKVGLDMRFPYTHFNIDRLVSCANFFKLPIFNFPIDSAHDHPKVEVVPMEKRELIPPKGDINHYLFRDNANRIIDVNSVSIFKIEDGIFSIDLTHQGRPAFYTFNKNKELITKFSSGLNPFIEDELIEIDEDICILDDQFSGAMNICHFLYDHITRIYLYEKFSKSNSYLLTENYQFYLDCITKIVPLNKLIMPGVKKFSIKGKSILFSSNIIDDFLHPAHYGNKEILGFIRTQLVSSDNLINEFPSKIYISRSDAKVRKISNEDELIALLEKHGYVSVTLGNLSYDQQVSIFSNASHVIGQHGAGLTNTVFCPEGSRILEIFNPFYGTWSFWHIFNQLDVRYYSYIAKDSELANTSHEVLSHNPSHGVRDIYINIDEFSLFLMENSF